MPNFKTCVASICICVFIAACNTQPSIDFAIKDSLQYSRDSTYGIIMKHENDTAFDRLMKKAQSELPAFIDSLKKQATNAGYQFAVKSAFDQDAGTEHMWSRVNAFKNGKFTGELADSAFYLTNVKTGDPVSIKREHVEDWIIFDNIRNNQYGYFSRDFLHDH